MKRLLDILIPGSKFGAMFFVALLGISILFILFQIGHNLPQDSVFLYGFGVFTLFPFFIGILTPITLAYKNKILLWESVGYSQLALVFVGISLLFLALEGLICIVMAAPIVSALTLIGSFIGYAASGSRQKNEMNVYGSFGLFLILFPAITYYENLKQHSEELIPIVTSVEIAAPPEKVWKNVVEFPELKPPTELLFKTGIAYPIRARIEGSGVGAIRYCEFSTGAFVEPITVWEENSLLQFSVEEQPIPMREISPYGNLDTPHLHDYFVSRKGQFKLTRLENGNTLLEGTTWYYHKIKPEFYWRFWSEQIVHTIHQRVLTHIKEESEKS
jgi:hypothetical protein